MRLALESLYHETPQLLQSKGAFKLSKKYLSNMILYARNGVRGLKPYEFKTHTVYTGTYGIYGNSKYERTFGFMGLYTVFSPANCCARMRVFQMAVLPQPAGPNKNTLHRTAKISRNWFTFKQNIASGWYPSSCAASFTCACAQ